MGDVQKATTTFSMFDAEFRGPQMRILKVMFMKNWCHFWLGKLANSFGNLWNRGGLQLVYLIGYLACKYFNMKVTSVAYRFEVLMDE